MLLQPGPSHLQYLTPIFKILNLFWSLILSKWKAHQFNYFNWLLILKNLVILNGSKNVPDVIQMALK